MPSLYPYYYQRNRLARANIGTKNAIPYSAGMKTASIVVSR